MKNKIIYILGICLFLISCKKQDTNVITYNHIGYIYNSIDSTSFNSTEFKLYNLERGVSQNKIEQEHFFYTDEGGYFNFTTKQSVGLLAWPSFHFGSAYTGPPYFSTSRSSEKDADGNYTYHYDTLYTEPYQ